MFAMVLYKFSGTAKSTENTELIEFVPLRQIPLYEESALTLPIFCSMYDGFSPSYLNEVKSSELVGVFTHLTPVLDEGRVVR